ncbi:MAG: hypothetical protein KA248_15265 [Kiritimatiellae bacterium]|nr:hypothetical protein [Kiritimatiellia bacterium]
MQEALIRRPRRLFAAGANFVFPALLILAIYAALVLVLPSRVFWSPDEGCKFIQMSGWSFEGRPAYSLPYPGKDRDPGWTYYPAAAIYPRPARDSDPVRFCWPVWFPVLSRLPYALFGIRGLYLLPMLSGLACAAWAAFLARRLRPGGGPVALLLVGLASPVFFYSLLFWEHTLAAALALWTLAAITVRVADDKPLTGWRLVLTFLPLAAAVALRYDMLMFLVALAATLAVFPPGSREGGRGRALVGLVAALLALWVAGALLRGAVTVFSREAGVAFPAYGELGTAFRERLSVWRETLAEAPDLLRCVLINDEAEFGWPLPRPVGWLVLSGLVIGLLSMALPAGAWRAGSWLAGAWILAGASFGALAHAERYRALHGLFVAAPWMLIAALPPSPAASARGLRFLKILGLVYLAAFAGVSWLVGRPNGGPEWGSRFALITYPLWASVAGAAAGRGPRRAGLASALVPATQVILVLLGLGLSLRGLHEIRATKHDLGGLQKELDPRVPVVTDLWWLSSALAPWSVRHPVFTLNPGASLPGWIEQVGSREGSFQYVGYRAPALDPRAGVPLTPRRLMTRHGFVIWTVDAAAPPP